MPRERGGARCREEMERAPGAREDVAPEKAPEARAAAHKAVEAEREAVEEAPAEKAAEAARVEKEVRARAGAWTEAPAGAGIDPAPNDGRGVASDSPDRLPRLAADLVRDACIPWPNRRQKWEHGGLFNLAAIPIANRGAKK